MMFLLTELIEETGISNHIQSAETLLLQVFVTPNSHGACLDKHQLVQLFELYLIQHDVYLNITGVNLKLY